MQADVEIHRTGQRRATAWLGLCASAASVVLGPGLLVGGPWPTLIWMLVTLVLIVTSVVALFRAERDPARIEGERGSVRIEANRLEVQHGGTTERLPLADIEGGYIERVNLSTRLVLQLRRGITVVAHFRDQHEKEARKLLATAGVDARAVAVTVPPAARSVRGVTGVMAVIMGVLGAPAPIAAFWTLGRALRGEPGAMGVALIFAGLSAMVVFGLYLLLRRALAASVLIGSDGIVVRRAFGGSRFIPHERLAAVDPTPEGLCIAHDRGRLTLRCESATAHMLVARIDEARRAREERGEAVELDLLDRAGRSLASWSAHLATLLTRAEGGYRRAALGLEQLLDVVEDPRASAERRIGAARALAQLEDDEVKQRVRIAAEGCAQAGMRVALLDACDGELESAAVEELLDAEETARRLDGARR